MTLRESPSPTEATADLRTLSKDLNDWLRSGTRIKEVGLGATTGSDLVAITGIPADDDPALTAYQSIRSSSNVTAVELRRGWSPNGLTEDLGRSSTIEYDDPATLLSNLASTSEALQHLNPAGPATWTVPNQLTVMTNSAPYSQQTRADDRWVRENGTEFIEQWDATTTS